jgi:hypothetical protein
MQKYSRAIAIPDLEIAGLSLAPPRRAAPWQHYPASPTYGSNVNPRSRFTWSQMLAKADDPLTYTFFILADLFTSRSKF